MSKSVLKAVAMVCKDTFSDIMMKMRKKDNSPSPSPEDIISDIKVGEVNPENKLESYLRLISMFLEVDYAFVAQCSQCSKYDFDNPIEPFITPNYLQEILNVKDYVCPECKKKMNKP